MIRADYSIATLILCPRNSEGKADASLYADNVGALMAKGAFLEKPDSIEYPASR